MQTVLVGVNIQFEEDGGVVTPWAERKIRIRIDVDDQDLLSPDKIVKELSDTLFYWMKAYTKILGTQVAFSIGDK